MMYYPCKVLGAGPSSTNASSPEYAIVSYLGYGTYDEVTPLLLETKCSVQLVIS
jgi:hypothetical protein